MPSLCFGAVTYPLTAAAVEVITIPTPTPPPLVPIPAHVPPAGEEAISRETDKGKHACVAEQVKQRPSPQNKHSKQNRRADGI